MECVNVDISWLVVDHVKIYLPYLIVLRHIEMVRDIFDPSKIFILFFFNFFFIS